MGPKSAITTERNLLRQDTDQQARQAAERQQKSHDAHATPRQLYARNYGAGPQWVPGQVVEFV